MYVKKFYYDVAWRKMNEELIEVHLSMQIYNERKIVIDDAEDCYRLWEEI